MCSLLPLPKSNFPLRTQYVPTALKIHEPDTQPKPKNKNPHQHSQTDAPHCPKGNAKVRPSPICCDDPYGSRAVKRWLLAMLACGCAWLRCRVATLRAFDSAPSLRERESRSGRGNDRRPIEQGNWTFHRMGLSIGLLLTLKSGISFKRFAADVISRFEVALSSTLVCVFAPVHRLPADLNVHRPRFRFPRRSIAHRQ